MAEAAAFVVKMLALKGAEAAVAAAVVNVAVNVAAYAAVNAVTRQNSEQKQQGGLIDLQLNSSAPRQLVIGKRMTGGVLVDWYLAGSNNTKLYMPVYLSEGPCGQVTRVFADGREVWSTPLVHGVRTTIPDFRSGGDRLWLTYYDGRVGQTADATLVALGQGWTSANTMTGCAYVVVECQWDSDNMRSPPSLSFEMEGAKLYDRRLDTTAGGSGSHRIDNPATWAFSDNPMVALDHFLLGRYWGGARTFGIGLSADEVPYSYFAAQANICDEDVALKAGGTQKRYRANGFIAANEDYASTITKLCTAMAARPADFGGRFGVIGVESKTPVLTIDDGDLIAGVQEVYTPKRSWSALVGEVEGRFQDPAQLYQPTPYPNVTDAAWEAEDGGEPKLMTFDLEFETHVERAQRLALLKARAERRQATLSGSYPLWTVELERGDWFVRTGAKWGVDGKTFEVIERVLNTETYTVTIVSQEVDAADSAWDESVAADGPPTPLAATDELSAVTAPSLTVTSNPIVGAASNTPALKIAFTNPTDPRVHTMFVEVYRASDDLKVATVPVTIPDADEEVIIQNGIADGVLYDVRAKYLTPGLSSAWSTTVSATTGSTYAVGTVAYATEAGSAAVGSALEADIAAAGASADADAAAAAASAAAAAASQTAAAGSATAASGSATSASSSQTAAAGSASAAASSASAAAASASAASGSASAASTSASAASTSASNAATSASAASTSATNAATQASNAATSATNASTSAASAAGSASTASTAATAAAASQSAAAGSASAASTSASTASTQASNAATSASAAATSATNASTSASNASTSASAASTSAGNAASSATTAGTHASNASGSASSASSSASAASASATAASNSATLSATYAAGSQGSINSSATFADNANATGAPTNWGDWSGASTQGTRVTGIAPQPYAFQLVGPAATETGISQALSGKLAVGWHVVEVDITLVSGALTGAGIYIDWGPSGGVNASDYLVFTTTPDITGVAPGAGTAGKLYKFRKLINVTTAADVGSMYAFSHWTGFSASIASANSITWHRCAIRAASQAEIEARQATLDLVTANANIATNASAIATANSSISTLTTTVSANQTTATTIRKNLLSNSTGIRGLTDWTNPSTWTSYEHPLWGHWFSRTFTGQSLTVDQFFSAEMAANPGEQYSLSFVPYLAGLTSGYAEVYLIWYNSAHGYIGESARVSLTSGMTRVRQKLEAQAAPTGTAYMRMSFTLHGPAVGSGSYAETGFWQAKVECGATATAWRADNELNNGLSRLATAEASIVTNASAITTEASARAAADTTLSARFNVKANLFPYPQPLNTTVPSGWVHTGLTIETWQPLGRWFYYKQRASGGSATTEYYYYDLEPTNTAYIDATATNQYTLSAVGYGGSGASGDRLMMYIELLNSSGTVIHASTPVLLNNYYPDLRPSTTTSYSGAGEYVRRRIVFRREWASSGSYQDAVFNYIKVENGSVATAYTAEGASSTLQASVTTNTSAIATLEGAVAVWEVVAAASGGTPARIGLKTGIGGATAWIDATKIFLGDNTFFEDAYNSFYTESGGKRNRFGGPFPASGDLMEWYGPTSVALNSETKTNGYWAKGTDGKMYYGAAELITGSNPLTCSFSPTNVTHTRTGGSLSPTPSVTATGGGGSGSYSYSWSVESIESGDTPTIANAGTATATLGGISMVAGEDAVGRLRCTVTDTTTGRQKAFFWSYSYIDLA